MNRRDACDSASAYVRAADWTATETRLDASLEQIVAAMQSAARTYAEAESQASRLFTV